MVLMLHDGIYRDGAKREQYALLTSIVLDIDFS